MTITDLVNIVKPKSLIIDSKEIDPMNKEEIERLSNKYHIKKYTYDIGNFLIIKIKK